MTLGVHGVGDLLIRHVGDPFAVEQVGGEVAARRARRVGALDAGEHGVLARLPGVQFDLRLGRRRAVALDPPAIGRGLGRGRALGQDRQRAGLAPARLLELHLLAPPAGDRRIDRRVKLAELLLAGQQTVRTTGRRRLDGGVSADRGDRRKSQQQRDGQENQPWQAAESGAVKSVAGAVHGGSPLLGKESWSLTPTFYGDPEIPPIRLVLTWAGDFP